MPWFFRVIQNRLCCVLLESKGFSSNLFLRLTPNKYNFERRGIVDLVCHLVISDLLGDALPPKPKLVEGTESIIVVDNVPVVGQDRCDKLKNVIRKVFSKFGKIITEYYPLESGKTKG